MKRNFFTILMLLMVAGLSYGAPWAQTYPLNGTTIMLTNQQVNTVWIPVTVLWKFQTVTNATLTVSRVSQGNTFLIGNLPVTNGANPSFQTVTATHFSLGAVGKFMILGGTQLVFVAGSVTNVLDSDVGRP